MRKFLLFLFLVSAAPAALIIVWGRVGWAIAIEIENDLYRTLKSYNKQD